MTLDVIERTVRKIHEWHDKGYITGNRVWATEYGYHWTIASSHPDWLPYALTRMQNAGVELTVIYDWFHRGGGWDTGLFSGTTPRSNWQPLVNWAKTNG